MHVTLNICKWTFRVFGHDLYLFLYCFSVGVLHLVFFCSFCFSKFHTMNLKRKKDELSTNWSFNRIVWNRINLFEKKHSSKIVYFISKIWKRPSIPIQNKKMNELYRKKNYIVTANTFWFLISISYWFRLKPREKKTHNVNLFKTIS